MMSGSIDLMKDGTLNLTINRQLASIPDQPNNLSYSNPFSTIFNQSLPSSSTSSLFSITLNFIGSTLPTLSDTDATSLLSTLPPPLLYALYSIYITSHSLTPNLLTLFIPFFQNFDSLSLSHTFIDDSHFLHLSSSLSSSLHTLDLSYTELTSINSLSSYSPNLTYLNLTMCRKMNSAGIRHVIRHLQSIKYLNLAGSRANSETLFTLSSSNTALLPMLTLNQPVNPVTSRISHLTYLNIEGCLMTTGLSHLLSLSPPLITLIITGCQMTSDNFEMISNIKDTLEYFSFQFNPKVNDHSLISLNTLSKLTYIDMSRNALLTQKTLNKLNNLQYLNTVNLARLDFNLYSFSELNCLNHLTSLDISYSNTFTDRSIGTLVTCKKIKYLYLSFTSISDYLLMDILPFNFPELTIIKITGCKNITDNGIIGFFVPELLNNTSIINNNVGTTGPPPTFLTTSINNINSNTASIDYFSDADDKLSYDISLLPLCHNTLQEFDCGTVNLTEKIINGIKYGLIRFRQLRRIGIWTSSVSNSSINKLLNIKERRKRREEEEIRKMRKKKLELIERRSLGISMSGNYSAGTSYSNNENNNINIPIVIGPIHLYDDEDREEEINYKKRLEEEEKTLREEEDIEEREEKEEKMNKNNGGSSSSKLPLFSIDTSMRSSPGTYILLRDVGKIIDPNPNSNNQYQEEEKKSIE